MTPVVRDDGAPTGVGGVPLDMARRGAITFLGGTFRIYSRTWRACLLIYGGASMLLLSVASVVLEATRGTTPVELLQLRPIAYARSGDPLEALIACVTFVGLLGCPVGAVAHAVLQHFALAVGRSGTARLRDSLRPGLRAVPGLLAVAGPFVVLGAAVIVSLVLLIGTASLPAHPLRPLATWVFWISAPALVITAVSLALVPPALFERRTSLRRAFSRGWALVRARRMSILGSLAVLSCLALVLWFYTWTVVVGKGVRPVETWAGIVVVSIYVGIVGAWFTILPVVAYLGAVEPTAAAFRGKFAPGASGRRIAQTGRAPRSDPVSRTLAAVEGLRHLGPWSVGIRHGYPVAIQRQLETSRFRTTFLVKLDSGAVPKARALVAGPLGKRAATIITGIVGVEPSTGLLVATQLAVFLTPAEAAMVQLDALISIAEASGPPPMATCTICRTQTGVTLALVDEKPTFVCGTHLADLSRPIHADARDLLWACGAAIFGIVVGAFLFDLVTLVFGWYPRPGALLIPILIGWLVQTAVRRITRAVVVLAVCAGVLALFVGDILLISYAMLLGQGTVDLELIVASYPFLLVLLPQFFAVSWASGIVGLVLVGRRMLSLAEDAGPQTSVVV